MESKRGDYQKTLILREVVRDMYGSTRKGVGGGGGQTYVTGKTMSVEEVQDYQSNKFKIIKGVVVSVWYAPCPPLSQVLPSA